MSDEQKISDQIDGGLHTKQEMTDRIEALEKKVEKLDSNIQEFLQEVDAEEEGRDVSHWWIEWNIAKAKQEAGKQ